MVAPLSRYLSTSNLSIINSDRYTYFDIHIFIDHNIYLLTDIIIIVVYNIHYHNYGQIRKLQTKNDIQNTKSIFMTLKAPNTEHINL